MKFAHVIQAVYLAPWNITREGWQAVDMIVRPHLESADLAKLLKSAVRPDGTIDEKTDIYGNPLPQYELTADGVAIIPIQGTLLHHASLMDKQCGAVSYQDIKRDVNRAIGEGANKIVFNVDSPGGMSMGASETGSFIARQSDFIQMEAVTDGLMCSAAYEVCAGVHKIFCTPTAQVGSIGTYLAWLDQSVRYQMAGVKVDVISSGPLKGAGVDGTTLTPEQRDNFQAQVNKFASMFKAHVTKHRIVEEHSMQGQSFIGDDAKAAGLVDDIIEDIDEAFEAYET